MHGDRREILRVSGRHLDVDISMHTAAAEFSPNRKCVESRPEVGNFLVEKYGFLGFLC